MVRVTRWWKTSTSCRRCWRRSACRSRPCPSAGPLMPVISNPEAQHRADLLSEIYYGGSRNTMLKTARHKYVIDQEGRGYML